VATLKRAATLQRNSASIRRAPDVVSPVKYCSGCASHHEISAFLPSQFTSDGWTDVCLASIRHAAQRDREARERRLEEAKAAATTPATKRCRTCRTEKPLAQFSPHRLARDGFRHDCRHCVKLGRAKSKTATAAHLARSRERAAKPEVRVRNRFNAKAWDTENPQAAQARKMVNRAKRKGLLIPPATCQIDGCSAAVHDAHHSDYGKPLSVLFVCRSHHRRLHLGASLKPRPGVSRRRARLPRT
jgi:hypothetical protein